MKNRILGIMIALVLLFGTVIPAFAQNTDSDKACQDALDARKQIENLDKKYAELKQKAYSEWEQQSKSDQYSGTWNEYAQKFFASDEVKKIQNLRQKYTEIDQKCIQYGQAVKSEANNLKSTTCTNVYYENIKKTFFAIEQKMIAAKERYYKEWESLAKSGKYSDSWEQYAKEKLHTSPEATEFQKAQVKYGSMIQLCQSEQVLSQPKMTQRPAGCNESEFEAAKKAMMESDSKVTALKERLYLEWKTLIDVGKITDSWDVFMKQHFDVAPEVKEWRQLQDKFSDIFHICTPANMDVIESNSKILQQSNEKIIPPNKSSDKKKEFDKYDELKKVKKTKKSKKTTSINQ